MNFTPSDQSARDASERSLSKTTFIAAGAGTGKTTTIVNRIANAICEPGGLHTIERLVAITFTERAAAELKSRVRQEFQKRAEAGSHEASAALASFESAQIGTIHAFAKRILNSFPIESGLPLTFEVLDEASSKLKVRDTASRFVETFFDSLDDQSKDLLHTFSITPLVFREFFIELNSKRLLVNQDDVLSGRQLDLTALVKEFVMKLNAWYEDQRTLWITFTPTLAPKIEENLTALNALFNDGKVITTEKIGEMQKLLNSLMRPGKAGGEKSNPFKEEARLNFEGGLSGLEFVSVENLIRSVLPRIWGTLNDEVLARYSRGEITFDDLIVLAVELIEKNSDVRAKIHKKFNLLVIDEFQDTDPLQWRLAKLVTTPMGEEGPVEGSLVLVGDSQQSIYSFRGADVSTYLNVQDLVGKPPMGGQLQTLQVNFRSNQKILSWVNQTFGHDSVALGADFTQLHPADSKLVSEDHSPGVAVIGGPDHEVNHKLEPAFVASAALKAVEHAWPVFEKGDKNIEGKFRVAKFSDVVILIPARTSLENLLEELSAREIPYRSSDSAIVYDRPVVRGLLDALKAVAGVAEPIDIWFALKSPLFGCDDFELLTYRRLGGTWSLPFGEPSTELASTRVYQSLSKLAEIRRESGTLKPAAALLRIAEDSRITSTYDQTPRGRFELECVQMVIRQARTWSNSGGLGIIDYIDWITDQLDENAREALPESKDQNDDAVRISTVHGVKGLEFPIVILAGMANQRMTKLPMISLKANRFEFKFISGSSLGYREISEKLEQQDRDAEHTRVLYVAATRARDHLVISNVAKLNKDGSTSSWSGLAREAVAETVRNGFASKFDQFVPPVENPTLTMQPKFAPEATEWLKKVDEIREISKKRNVVTPSTLSGESVDANHASLGSVLVDENQELLVNYVDDEIAGSDVAKLGNAFHSTMEFIIESTSKQLDNAVINKVESALLEYGVSDHKERLIKMLGNVLESALLQRIFAADRIWPEIQMAEINSDGELVEGFADLVIQEGQDLIVIDYKTNLQLDPAKLAKYKKQLDAYSQIIESATNLTVSEKLIFHVLPEKVETLVI